MVQKKFNIKSRQTQKPAVDAGMRRGRVAGLKPELAAPKDEDNYSLRAEVQKHSQKVVSRVQSKISQTRSRRAVVAKKKQPSKPSVVVVPPLLDAVRPLPREAWRGARSSEKKNTRVVRRFLAICMRFVPLGARHLAVAGTTLLERTGIFARWWRRLIKERDIGRLVVFGSAFVGIIVVGALARFFVQGSQVPPALRPAGDVSGTGTEVSQQIATQPSFEVALPATASDELRSPVVYEPEKKVASFTDKINGITVTVSQQELPERFRADPSGTLSQFAADNNAKDIVEGADVRAYLGTSIKGPQTLMFISKDLLVFIVSPEKVDTASWSDYISRF